MNTKNKPGPRIRSRVGPEIRPRVGPQIGPRVRPRVGPQVGPQVEPTVTHVSGNILVSRSGWIGSQRQNHFVRLWVEFHHAVHYPEENECNGVKCGRKWTADTNCKHSDLAFVTQSSSSPACYWASGSPNCCNIWILLDEPASIFNSKKSIFNSNPILNPIN